MRRPRLVLAIAIAAAVASLAAIVAGPTALRGPSRGAGGRHQPGARPAPPPVTLDLRPGRRPPDQVATSVGRHVVLRVAVTQPGEVDLLGLGLTDSATPEASATFDLLPDRPGTYKAIFRPAVGGPQLAGTLVVRRR